MLINQYPNASDVHPIKCSEDIPVYGDDYDYEPKLTDEEQQRINEENAELILQLIFKGIIKF